MTAAIKGTFHCVMYTPQTKLLDCRARSVVLPGHDGCFGILRNHCPMIYKLEMGIAEIYDGQSQTCQLRPVEYFLIGEGFVRVNDNNLVILAAEAVYLDGMPSDKAKAMLENAAKMIASRNDPSVRCHSRDIRRAGLICRLGELAGYKA